MSVFLPDPEDLHDYQSTRCVHDTAQWMQIARENLKNQRITQVSVDTCFRVRSSTHIRLLVHIVALTQQVILPGSHDSGAYELSNKAGSDRNWSALRCFLGCCCK